LNALELAALTTPTGPDGRQHVTLASPKNAYETRA